MSSKTQRITPYSISQFAEKAIEDMTNKELRKFATEVKKTAQINFANADYAGPDSDKNVKIAVRKTKKGKYSVTAKGPAVNFIEFGTGVVGENAANDEMLYGHLPSSYVYDLRLAGPPSHPDGEDWWAFKMEGNSDSSFIRPLTRKVYPTYEYDTVTKPYERIDKYGNAVIEYKVYNIHGVAKATDEEKISVDVPGVYSTEGNEPNNCMYLAMEEVSLDWFGK